MEAERGFGFLAKRSLAAINPSRIPSFSLAFLALLLLSFPADYSAQQKASDYVRTEEMVPMRDGIRLYTQVDAPAKATEKLPIIFLRTPYGLGSLTAEQVAGGLPGVSREGFILVRQK